VKKFEAGSLYQPAAQSQGFAPIRVPDYTTLLRQNEQRRQQDEANQERQAQRQDEFDRMNMEFMNSVDTKRAEQIAMISETAGKAVKKLEEGYIKQQGEFGLMKAYTEGIPDEIRNAYNEQKISDQAIDAEAKATAAEAEAAGAPTDVSSTLRGLSKWARDGYLKGISAQAGAEYPAIRQQLAGHVRVQVPGREEPILLEQARTSAEYNAVVAEIDRQFMAQFAGVSPAILNETLFPQMKAYNKKESIAFAAKLKTAHEEQKKQEFKDEIFTITRTPALVQEHLMNAIQRHAAGYGPGANGKVRKMFWEHYVTLTANGKIPPEVSDFLEGKVGGGLTFDAFDGSGKVFFHKYYANELSTLKLDVKRLQADRAKIAIEEQETLKLTREFDQGLETFYDQRGIPPTKEEIHEAYQKFWQIDGISYADKSPYLEAVIAKEEHDIDTDFYHLQNLIDRNHSVTESQLSNFHIEAVQRIRTLYKDRIVDEGEQFESPFRKDFKEVAKGISNDIIKAQGFHRGVANTDFERNMMAEYDKAYRMFMSKDNSNPKAAHDQAEALVRTKATTVDPTTKKYNSSLLGYKPPTPVYKKYNALATVAANGNNWRAAIPALKDDAESLAFWNGKGPLPLVFRSMAASLRNTDGSRVSPFDFAAAQYKEWTGKDLPKPKSQEVLDKLDYSSWELVNHKPSEGRLYRAGTNGNWQPILDMIASVESEGFGDYNAMNVPYTHVPSNSEKTLGKGLVKMTIGDVLDLMEQDKLHAAGRYQFTNHQGDAVGRRGQGTLYETMLAAGLSRDDMFNEANQDKLAITRMLWRKQHGGATIGNFGNEWEGFKGLDTERRNKLQVLLDALPSRSPYNTIENLDPRVMRTLVP
jgi:hypothetical protein